MRRLSRESLLGDWRKRLTPFPPKGSRYALRVVGTSSVSRRPPQSGRRRSLRCASSPHRTRFAGLRRGPHVANNSTLAPRKVFFRRTRRRKNDLIFFRRLRAAELCEAFCYTETARHLPGCFCYIYNENSAAPARGRRRSPGGLRRLVRRPQGPVCALCGRQDLWCHHTTRDAPWQSEIFVCAGWRRLSRRSPPPPPGPPG